jgi:tetratricopeptide (TPR) repeat protein
MVKVSLRGYNREIEGMIEGGLLDESVAHCQHILKTFPMHVETYRLLGKSFLEARRYSDAADIFQRTLMAVPDDFVSQVGMSIIRDDEGKLDNAIWHMERAFETQPSNPAIQGELRRLYGRRDGVEPTKIRLSRDALANMYSQGELFNQAITEIRAVLAEDPNRPDLQIMLARAYYRAGQKVEAAEMAANLLKKYTYCLDALRILVDVLPGTARAENTQVYRQRLGMLDPYSTFVSGSTFNSDQVAEMAINLERLEYKTGNTPSLPQPNWAASLGIKLLDEKHVEPAPDWMTRDSSNEQTPAAPVDAPEPKAVPASDDIPVPDWMSNAGWHESDGKGQEGPPVDLSTDQLADPIAKADIPDWLKSMAPQEVTNAVNDGSTTAPADAPSPNKGDTPDWLSKFKTAAVDANPDPSQPASSAQDNGGLPDWLKDIGAGVAAGTAVPNPADGLDQPKAEETLVSTQPAAPEPTSQASFEPPLTVAHPEDETPIQATGESTPLNIEDDAMAWLESLAAKQGAKPEELLTKPEDRSAEMPDWLRPVDEQPSTSVTPEDSPSLRVTSSLEESLSPPAGELVNDETTPSEETPSFTAPAEETATTLIPGDDSKAWLDSLAAKTGVKAEDLATEGSQRSETPPDWMDKTTPEQPVQDGSLTPETTQEDVTITTWLRKQDVIKALGRETLPPDEEPQAVIPPSEELPDWLKDLNKQIEPKETPKPAEELPDWLDQSVQPAISVIADIPKAEPAIGPEMPAITEEKIPVMETPAPTTPGEWVPVDEKPAAVSNLEPIPEPASPAIESPVQLRVLGGTGMLARIPTLDKDAEFLAAAQTALDAHQLNEAMQAYAKLIKKNRLLDEVIHDLREAIYRFPVDIIVWQTLGDASMRANHLQDALDAYTKAEELLR